MLLAEGTGRAKAAGRPWPRGQGVWNEAAIKHLAQHLAPR